MTDRTLTWKERADRIGLKADTIARVTGKTARTVHAYRRGDRTPSAEWLDKVERMLDEIEVAVSGGTAA